MVNPILIIAISLFGAFFIAFISPFVRRIGRIIAFLTIGFDLYIGATLALKSLTTPVIAYTAGFKPPFSINLVVEPFSAVFLLIVLTIGFLVSLYYLAHPGEEPEDKFFTLLILNIMGASGIIMTGDLFNLFVFFEITAISSYALVSIRKQKASLEGGIKYLIISSIGSSLFLVAITLLYGQTGTLNIADIAAKLPLINKSVALVAFLLILVAFFVESEIFPFNGWAPDAYQGAEEGISALLAGVISKAGLYALIRLTFTLLDLPLRSKLLIVFGIMTFLIAELSALKQKRVKRMLAYSSIGQMGLVVAIFGIGTIPALKAAIFQGVNHAVSKVALFLLVGMVIKNIGIYKLDDYKGLGRKNPLLGLLFSLAILNLLGFPLFAGFWSKLSILLSTGKQGLYLLLSLILTGAIVEVYYYVRFMKILYERNEEASHLEIHLLEAIPIIAMAAFILIIGVNPGLITPLFEKASEAIFMKFSYINLVIGG